MPKRTQTDAVTPDEGPAAEQIARDAETPPCPECGHRALQHRLGKELCNLPGCICTIGT